MENHLNQFLTYLRAEKRSSSHTLLAYERDLRQFMEFLADDFEIDEVTDVSTSAVRSWLMLLNTMDYEPRSIHRKMSSLRTFFKFLRREEICVQDPMVNVKGPKIPKRLPTYVDEKAMERLLDDFEYPEGYEGLRDKLLVTLFYETGIRLSELIGLNVNDLESRGQIKVLGKRNKERILPITQSCVTLIEESLTLRIAEVGELEKDAPLLLDENGKRLSPKFVYGKVNYYLGKVSTVQKKSPHILRHTFATHLLNNGAHLNTVKELLGHSNLSATQIYTHNSIEQLKSIHQKNHPRG
ncbi:MAG: tyrosine-type recombinase/integrase [Flavobacteriales bacterium]|nr:tyrosine-type recombinase/integrase [Flavobacteriales bacterium]